MLCVHKLFSYVDLLTDACAGVFSTARKVFTTSEILGRRRRWRNPKWDDNTQHTHNTYFRTLSNHGLVPSSKALGSVEPEERWSRLLVDNSGLSLHRGIDRRYCQGLSENRRRPRTGPSCCPTIKCPTTLTINRTYTRGNTVLYCSVHQIHLGRASPGQRVYSRAWLSAACIRTATREDAVALWRCWGATVLL